MSQVMRKAGIGPGSLVFLADGSTATVGANGLITVPDGSIDFLLNDGWTYAEAAAVLAVVRPNMLTLPAGGPLASTEAAGGFNVSLSSNVFVAQGEITDNETEVSVAHAMLNLPSDYVAGTDLTVRIPANIVQTAAAVNNGSTLDLEVRKQLQGAVGSDLCQTAAQTFAATSTWYDKEFTIAGATLSPGDVLMLEITSTVIDSEAGGGTLRMNLDAISVIGVAAIA